MDTGNDIGYSRYERVFPGLVNQNDVGIDWFVNVGPTDNDE